MHRSVRTVGESSSSEALRRLRALRWRHHRGESRPQGGAAAPRAHLSPRSGSSGVREARGPGAPACARQGGGRGSARPTSPGPKPRFRERLHGHRASRRRGQHARLSPRNVTHRPQLLPTSLLGAEDAKAIGTGLQTDPLASRERPGQRLRFTGMEGRPPGGRALFGETRRVNGGQCWRWL